jgi:hypothetical protein
MMAPADNRETALMTLVRIRKVTLLGGLRVRLTLTDNRVVERDLSALMVGSIFDPLRSDPARFSEVTVEAGTLVWPNGADFCPDVLIWNGPPPEKPAENTPRTAQSRGSAG